MVDEQQGATPKILNVFNIFKKKFWQMLQAWMSLDGSMLSTDKPVTKGQNAVGSHLHKGTQCSLVHGDRKQDGGGQGQDKVEQS